MDSETHLSKRSHNSDIRTDNVVRPTDHVIPKESITEGIGPCMIRFGTVIGSQCIDTVAAGHSSVPFQMQVLDPPGPLANLALLIPTGLHISEWCI